MFPEELGMLLQAREETHGPPPSPGAKSPKIVPSDYESFAFTAGRDNCRGHQRPTAPLCREELPGDPRLPHARHQLPPAAAEPPGLCRRSCGQAGSGGADRAGVELSRAGSALRAGAPGLRKRLEHSRGPETQTSSSTSSCCCFPTNELLFLPVSSVEMAG
ncbi:hypothetical protein DV515_00013709, partial [Chloebia gouldiae]